MAAARARSQPLADMYYRWGCCWTMELWEPAVRGVLTAVGVDLARVRADTTPAALMLPLERHAAALAEDTSAGEPPPNTAPNVVGTVAGWDTTLKHQYVVVMAPMDQAGAPTDASGADTSGDNAVSVTGLIELARAFAQPGARPRRPLLFVAVSGERAAARGTQPSGESPSAWGRRAFVKKHFVPRPALTVLLDLSGGLDDAVAVAGLGDLKLPNDPRWVAAGHPELGVTLVDAGTPFPQTFGGEPIPVAGAALPGLALHWAGPAPARVASPVRAGSDPAPGPDPARAARVLQTIYYLIADAANAAAPPQWSDAGRRRNLGEP